MRSRCTARSPICVMLITEVLLHRIACAEQMRSNSTNMFCFTARFSVIASMTTSAPAQAAARIARHLDACQNGRDGGIVHQSVGGHTHQVGAYAISDRGEPVFRQILHADRMPARGENLRDARPHHAGADDSQCFHLFPSPPPMGAVCRTLPPRCNGWPGLCRCHC